MLTSICRVGDDIVLDDGPGTSMRDAIGPARETAFSARKMARVRSDVERTIGQECNLANLDGGIGSSQSASCRTGQSGCQLSPCSNTHMTPGPPLQSGERSILAA